MTHAALVTRAYKTLDNVHSDQSVALKQTLDSLEELRDHIDMLIAAIEEDIEREQAELS